jgi:hypothetical protein
MPSSLSRSTWARSAASFAKRYLRACSRAGLIDARRIWAASAFIAFWVSKAFLERTILDASLGLRPHGNLRPCARIHSTQRLRPSTRAASDFSLPDQNFGPVETPPCSLHRPIQLAWLWVRHQPHSALTQWFKERVKRNGGRLRKTTIVALARKLLVALWKYVNAGIVIEGAIVKSASGLAQSTETRSVSAVDESMPRMA